MELIAQIIGWIGTVLIVGAYFLISNKRVDSHRACTVCTTKKGYQLMNLMGAIFVGINVFYQHAWPAVALQVLWGIIAIISLIKKN